ncbi:hypothetical protein [Amycolatopsis sp. cmx-11-12]|uniref:hypothetical protein n=1 Tax=Amycolatopsis sp. cmx-11-12 TaxID=2785795 RepID=UPI003916CD0B
MTQKTLTTKGGSTVLLADLTRDEPELTATPRFATHDDVPSVLHRLEQVAQRMRLDIDHLVSWLEWLADEQFTAPQPSRLTTRELNLLHDMGITDVKAPPWQERSSLRAAAEYSKLVESSYTIAEAAEQIGCNRTEIIARLKDRSIFSIDVFGIRRIPVFQFTEAGYISGLEDVLPALPPDLTVLEVVGFLNNPTVELESRGRTWTPLQWLKEGFDSSIVVTMANEFGMWP